MKIWFETCHLDGYFEDSSVKFGIGWYHHHKDHKWKGFTVQFYGFGRVLCMNCVDNYKEYDKRINYRKSKKLET